MSAISEYVRDQVGYAWDNIRRGRLLHRWMELDELAFTWALLFLPVAAIIATLWTAVTIFEIFFPIIPGYAVYRTLKADQDKDFGMRIFNTACRLFFIALFLGPFTYAWYRVAENWLEK